MGRKTMNCVYCHKNIKEGQNVRLISIDGKKCFIHWPTCGYKKMREEEDDEVDDDDSAE
jgi:hypothetical protein